MNEKNRMYVKAYMRFSGCMCRFCYICCAKDRILAFLCIKICEYKKKSVTLHAF